ncbi:hypothetical protein P9112_011282 [Eukaryota sp. TZLM1-RC]
MHVCILVNKMSSFLLNLRDFLQLNHHHVVFLDCYTTLKLPPNIDVLIHKLNHHNFRHFDQHLISFTKSSRRVIDPIHYIMPVSYRRTMFDALFLSDKLPPGLQIPKTIVASLANDPCLWLTDIITAKHQFSCDTVIIKSNLAVGSPRAHQLAILNGQVNQIAVSNSELLPCGDCVIQCFIHGTFIKVYVIVTKSEPLEFVTWASCSSNQPFIKNGLLIFDSSSTKSVSTIPKSTDSTLRLYSQFLINSYHLSFFGFDMIYDGSQYFVVDVNYLPSFNGCVDAELEAAKAITGCYNPYK